MPASGCSAATAQKVALTREDILAALKWGPPREVTTKVGPRITREATATGDFDGVFAFTPGHIAPDYAAAHADVLNATRGSGYWLWKPYFLARLLAEVAAPIFGLWHAKDSLFMALTAQKPL